MAKQTTLRKLKDDKKVLINDILNDNLHGKIIYLLGSAEFGPTNEPTLVKSTTGLYHKFGKQGTLIDAFHALKYTSKDNQVYLVKTTGEHANAYLNVNISNGEIIEDAFIISSSQSNEIFNEIEVIIDSDKIKFVFPEDLLDYSLEYHYKDYPTIDMLATAINKDTKNKRSYLYAHYTIDPFTPTENAFFVCNPTTMYLYGGECGLHYTKNLLYNCLKNTYSILESHDIDIVIPVDAFMDDIYPDDAEEEQYQYNMKYYHPTKDYLTEDFTGKKLSFMNQLLQFCIIQLNFGMVTTGIIGYNSMHKYWNDYLYEADDVADMLKACYEYNLANCENKFYAFLLSVVAGDIRYNKGTIIDNGYLAYAALCAKTTRLTGTTNLPISNTISIYQEFSEEKLQELATTGIVAFRHSPLFEQAVVYDGITASPEHENLKLFCNVRMIQMCISYINRLFQFYIGHSINDLIEENIIIEDLHNILKILVSKKVITEYDFKIVPSYTKGTIKVYLSLLTNYMVKALKLCSEINMTFEEE